MGRRSKSYKRPAAIIEHVAQNVRVLRDIVYAGERNTTARNRALAKAADTTLSHVQRVVAGRSAAGVDLIEALAIALGVRPQDLMTPYFAGTAATRKEQAAMTDTGMLQPR